MSGATDDIVLVDDDALVAEFLRRVLRGSERELRVFSDPRDALDYLSDHLARVLLVDTRMPAMDGPELLARLARRGRAGGLRVILCSASSRTLPDDAPAHVELLSKDDLLDRRTLLGRLGGPRGAAPAAAA